MYFSWYLNFVAFRNGCINRKGIARIAKSCSTPIDLLCELLH